MGETKWERLASLTGVVMAALLAVRTLITPSPHTYLIVEAGPYEMATWFLGHRGVLLLAVWMTGLIVVAGTWFHGGLRAYLSRQGASRLAGIGFAGWILVGTISLVRHAMLSVLVLYALPLDANLSIIVVGQMMLGMVWFGAFITAIAVAIAGARFSALPWWFNFGTAVEAVILGAGTLVVLTGGSGGYFSLSGDFRWIVLWSYIAWAAIGGLVLYSRLGKEREAPAA